MVGDQRHTVRSDGTTKYLQMSGSYPTKSRLVTVESVLNTVDYIDENGNLRLNSASSSLITDPALTTTSPLIIKSSKIVLPKIRSDRGSTIFSPSFKSEMTIPFIVPQSVI